MQYSTIFSILAGAAAVSAGITDGLTEGLLGSSLSGNAAAAADAKAKGTVIDDAAEKPERFTKLATDAPADAASKADADDALAAGGILDGLGLKQMLQPKAYPYDDPSTTRYRTIATPTTVTVTATATATATTERIVDPPRATGDVMSSAVESCSEGTKTSCCDTKAASDGFLSNVLGGSCALSNLKIPVLAVGAIGGGQCNQGNTFCCPITQNGNLNIALACIPLSL